MTDFNQSIVLGNLTRDPEVRHTTAGQPVANFSVATNRRWTNQQGQPQDEAEFHNVVAFGKLAEICSQILYKGRKVLVSGRLRTRSWEGQDGSRRQTTEIIAENVSALGAPRAAGETALGNEDSASKTEPVADREKSDSSEKNTKEAKSDKAESKDEEINLDDIPF